MKQTINKFICDNCHKRKSRPQPKTFDSKIYPYSEGWIYVYCMEIKIDVNKFITLEDKHFCSLECYKKHLDKLVEIKNE